jgi:curved DNA-binding protein CbpA
MPKHIQNHYEFLGVSPQATIEEIKQHIIQSRLLFPYHSDHNESSSTNEITRRINEAWEILSDPVRRSEYDDVLNSQSPSAIKYRKPTKVHSRTRYRRASHIDIDYKTAHVENAKEYYPGFSLQKKMLKWETAKKILKWTVIAVFFLVVIFIALVASSSKTRRRY